LDSLYYNTSGRKKQVLFAANVAQSGAKKVEKRGKGNDLAEIFTPRKKLKNFLKNFQKPIDRLLKAC